MFDGFKQRCTVLVFSVCDNFRCLQLAVGVYISRSSDRHQTDRETNDRHKDRHKITLPAYVCEVMTT